MITKHSGIRIALIAVLSVLLFLLGCFVGGTVVQQQSADFSHTDSMSLYLSEGMIKVKVLDLLADGEVDTATDLLEKMLRANRDALAQLKKHGKMRDQWEVQIREINECLAHRGSNQPHQ